jgi:uncharacterized protein YcnI
MQFLSAVAATLLFANAAHAHISVASGPGVANATNEIALGVGHGCAGADTLRVKVDIPAGVTSVRTMTSDFGKATLTKDAAGAVTAVTWEKPAADLLAADEGYYRLVLRVRLPDQPFTTIYFKSHQTCRSAAGVESVTDWVGLPTDPAVPDGGTPVEPAAPLPLLPARTPGWNKFTVPAAMAMADLSTFFKDAAIVWKGTAAFSVNPATDELIGGTPGVTKLTSLAPADVIWVKY